MREISNVKSATLGRERMVLESLGMELPRPGRHGPCPGCGGKDRFRMERDDSHFWCSQGTGVVIHGDIFDLIRHVYGWGLSKTVNLVGEMLGVDSAPATTKHRFEGKHWSQFGHVARAVLIAEIAARDREKGKTLSTRDNAALAQSGKIIDDFIKKGGRMRFRQEEIQDEIDIIKRAYALKINDSLPKSFTWPPSAAAEAVSQYIDEGGSIDDDQYPHEWFADIVHACRRQAGRWTKK